MAASGFFALTRTACQLKEQVGFGSESAMSLNLLCPIMTSAEETHGIERGL